MAARARRRATRLPRSTSTATPNCGTAPTRALEPDWCRNWARHECGWVVSTHAELVGCSRRGGSRSKTGLADASAFEIDWDEPLPEPGDSVGELRLSVRTFGRRTACGLPRDTARARQPARRAGNPRPWRRAASTSRPLGVPVTSSRPLAHEFPRNTGCAGCTCRTSAPSPSPRSSPAWPPSRCLLRHGGDLLAALRDAELDSPSARFRWAGVKSARGVVVRGRHVCRIAWASPLTHRIRAPAWAGSRCQPAERALLAAIGEPMLLDFHLARCPSQVPSPRGSAGTTGYMAPELAAAAHGRPPRRANTSSLWTRATSARRRPLTRSTRPRRRHALVPRSPPVCEVLGASHRGSPGRSPTCGSRRGDLRRLLLNLPRLRGAGTAISPSRWRKWRRWRRRSALPVLLVVTALGLFALGVGSSLLLTVGPSGPRRWLREGESL